MQSEIHKTDNRKKIGNAGEEKASLYLSENGYTILERNWRVRNGELDIVAEKNCTLVFVEVKTLPHGNLEFLSHVLDERKQKKIIEISKCFLASHRQYNNSVIRYDVIVLDMPGLPEVYHIENAFSELS